MTATILEMCEETPQEPALALTRKFSGFPALRLIGLVSVDQRVHCDLCSAIMQLHWRLCEFESEFECSGSFLRKPFSFEAIMQHPDAMEYEPLGPIGKEDIEALREEMEEESAGLGLPGRGRHFGSLALTCPATAACASAAWTVCSATATCAIAAWAACCATATCRATWTACAARTARCATSACRAGCATCREGYCAAASRYHLGESEGEDIEGSSGLPGAGLLLCLILLFLQMFYVSHALVNEKKEKVVSVGAVTKTESVERWRAGPYGPAQIALFWRCRS